MILKGAAARDHRDARYQQGLSYSLARLLVWSFHDPKKMPKFDKVFPDGRPKPAQSDAEILAAMKQWTAAIEAAKKGRK